jgi:hypothetical protein
MLALLLLSLGLLYLSRGIPILRGRLGLKHKGDCPELLPAMGLTLTLLGLALTGGALVVAVVSGLPSLS